MQANSWPKLAPLDLKGPASLRNRLLPSREQLFVPQKATADPKWPHREAYARAGKGSESESLRKSHLEGTAVANELLAGRLDSFFSLRNVQNSRPQRDFKAPRRRFGTWCQVLTAVLGTSVAASLLWRWRKGSMAKDLSSIDLTRLAGAFGTGACSGPSSLGTLWRATWSLCRS